MSGVCCASCGGSLRKRCAIEIRRHGKDKRDFLIHEKCLKTFIAEEQRMLRSHYKRDWKELLDRGPDGRFKRRKK